MANSSINALCASSPHGGKIDFSWLIGVRHGTLAAMQMLNLPLLLCSKCSWSILVMPILNNDQRNQVSTGPLSQDFETNSLILAVSRTSPGLVTARNRHQDIQKVRNVRLPSEMHQGSKPQITSAIQGISSDTCPQKSLPRLARHYKRHTLVRWILMTDESCFLLQNVGGCERVWQ